MRITSRKSLATASLWAHRKHKERRQSEIAASKAPEGEELKMTSASLNPAPKPFDQRKRMVVVRVAALMAVLLLLFAEPFLAEGSQAHELVEMFGLVLVLVCVGGRLWSTLYIGGRKNSELISMGPFSMTQNPLYFFSTLGALGIGLIYGSVLAALALGLASFIVFRVTAGKEAEFLSGKFGDAYEAYRRKTPRFWPNPLLFQDNAERQFSTHALKRTFYDGLFFLALFPAIETIEYLRMNGFLPKLFVLF
jgi:protein-S-isoprenylcysteine O-methyltransferase Ste14